MLKEKKKKKKKVKIPGNDTTPRKEKGGHETNKLVGFIADSVAYKISSKNINLGEKEKKRGGGRTLLRSEAR
jgi:hypothetical protein